MAPSPVGSSCGDTVAIGRSRLSGGGGGGVATTAHAVSSVTEGKIGPGATAVDGVTTMTDAAPGS